MASVSLRHVTKTFDAGARPALHDLSLDVADGELLVLLGPSGCGKTTALRCIAGLEPPTAGEIHIGDRDVTQLPPGDRDVAMVFQPAALYPHLRVRENIAFPLTLGRTPRSQITRKVIDIAERLGLTAELDRRPAQLSEGQRQRVALARAAVREPRVFLLDEPLAHLDGTARLELRAELSRLHQALGATMIYVTHDEVEAMTLGQRIAVLQDGHVRQMGTPVDVYERPADAFVARFVGAPGMNVLAGVATHKRRGTHVECGSLTIPVPLREYDGDIQVGVRPEHVLLCGIEDGVGAVEVRMVESHGAETLVHLDAGGVPLVARVPGFPHVAPGEKIGVAIEAERLHFFDAAGVRLA
ncbi:MAG TPA: ABC transporter ATP-binding protein [Gemmatimonadales bacterium]|nr:ABC transporter ATP-binding protein [Gemmatimonadales bacterium]